MSGTGLFGKRGVHIQPRAYVTARAIRGMRGPNDNQKELATRAVFLALQQHAPPAAEQYQAWLDTQHSAERPSQGSKKWDGRKLRRAVVMKRNGCTLAEIGSSIGICTSYVGTTLNALPEGLAA